MLHIIYDEKTEKYEEFELHPERKDNNFKNEVKKKSWETSQSMCLKRHDSMEISQNPELR